MKEGRGWMGGGEGEEDEAQEEVAGAVWGRRNGGVRGRDWRGRRK